MAGAQGKRQSLVQEPRLTTAETMKTPLSLVVAFPKHAEDGYSSKVLRCGYKPPGATALTGKELLHPCDSLHSTIEQAAFPQYTLDRSKRMLFHVGIKPQYKGPMWLLAWLHAPEGYICGCLCQGGSQRCPEKVLFLAVGSASGTWVAWGQLYIDNGEETDLALGGVFVNFRAEVQPSGNGMLTGTFSSTGQAPTSVLSTSISATRTFPNEFVIKAGRWYI